MFLSTVPLVAFVLSGTLCGDVPSPGERDVKLCQFVLKSLETTHISGRPFDDTLARRLFDLYLEALDPDRLYFLQSDVEEFKAERDTLDDRLAAGSVEFAMRVYNRLLERIESRAEALIENVAVEHDFDADEYHFLTRHLADYPTENDVAEVCRKRIKFLLLEKMADGASLPQARKAVAGRLDAQHNRLRDLDIHRVTSMYLAAAASAYDPHTRYLSPAALKNLEISLTLRLVGIGAHLRSEDGVTVVTKLVAGGAAEKDARLQPGDRIVAVAQGEKGKFIDVRGVRLELVVQMIRGAVETIVRLRVLHGDDSPELITMRRAAVELVDRVAKGRTRTVRFDEKDAITIGILDLPAFYGTSAESPGKAPAKARSSTDDVARILTGFQAQGVDAVIFDLRENSGGLLEEALGVAGLFIDAGPLVQIKGRTDEPRVMLDERPGMVWDGPLVVLTSRYTASAAEIVAGAVQDYRRGLVVGAPATFGKGTVQSIVPLGDEAAGPKTRELGALKVTVSRFYRPLGASTQERGVAADLELPSPGAFSDRREAALPGALAFDRIGSAEIERDDFVRPGMTAKLALLSEKRIETSVDFERIRDNIARSAELRARKWVRLRLYDVRALTAAKDTSPLLRSSTEAAIDAALEEALEITRDYVLALEG